MIGSDEWDEAIEALEWALRDTVTPMDHNLATLARFASLALAAAITLYALEGCPKPPTQPEPDSGFLTDGAPPPDDPRDDPRDPPPPDDPPRACPGRTQCPCDLGCRGALTCGASGACTTECTSDRDCSSGISGETCLGSPGRCAIVCDPGISHGGCPRIDDRQAECFRIEGAYVCGFGGER